MTSVEGIEHQHQSLPFDDDSFAVRMQISDALSMDKIV